MLPWSWLNQEGWLGEDMLEREIDCLEFCCEDWRGVTMTFRVKVIVNTVGKARQGKASSVICFGTVGITVLEFGWLMIRDWKRSL